MTTLELASYRPFSFPLFAFTTLICLAGSLIFQKPILRLACWAGTVSGNVYLATSTTTGHPVADYYLGAIYAGGVFVATDYVFFTVPLRDLKRVGQKDTHEGASKSFMQRLRWGLKRWSSIRSVGWEDEPAVFRSPLPESTTRRAFVLRRLLTTAVNVFILDACSIYNRANPAFQTHGISMAARPSVWRYLDVAVWACTCQAHMRIVHGIVSLGSVSVGASTPQEWVHPFGYWKDAYTLRRLWGRTWHQVPRRCMSVPGKFLARNVFNFAPGSFASSWTQLCTSFSLSTLLHLTADFTMLKEWNIGGSIPMFPLQPVAIMVEDIVLAGASSFGLQKKLGSSGHVLGYIWVWTWFTVLSPSWFDPMVRMGFVELGLNIPFSIILGVWRGEWSPSAPSTQI